MFKSIFVVLLSVATTTTVVRAQTLPQMRMTPAEITGSPTDNNQIGSSGLAGVHTKVLFGDPAKAGFYSILLFVPSHVTIEAHTHRDNRMATVVSGEWHFGYGDHFDVKKLKTLPPGSVYSEPGGVEHFAQTAETAVVVQISGYGPTDTKYFDPANDPAAAKKCGARNPQSLRVDACKAPDPSPHSLSITSTTNVSNKSGNLLSLKS